MAAVLRVAGGLDRSHNQIVRSVEVTGTPEQVELIVTSDEYPEVDLWAARRRMDLFVKSFGDLMVQWAGHADASGQNGQPRTHCEATLQKAGGK
jgi:hypothetical protein